MVIEKAICFAIKAHEDQIRKIDPSLPMITHPIIVAHILREYEMDENVIAAGYLHDVVEDTKYTIEDINELFGIDISYLVETATEPNKNLSWKKRKQNTIDRVYNLPFRNKAVICADKIHNLESLYYDFYRKGFEDWSLFKTGRDAQEWYFRNVYKSLIANEDKNHPMFIRLDCAIEDLFRVNKNILIKKID